MSSLPSVDLIVEVAPGVDLTGFTLTPDEGFMLSRAMGRKQTIAELVQVSGLAKDKCLGALAKLIEVGALKAVSQIGGDVMKEEFEGFLFPPGPMNENVELTKEQKKRILFIDSKLDEWNHYELLGLKRSADRSAVKRGYFRASKEFHPDAFFRKNIGTYKARIDRIFRAMKNAYDVVSNAKKKDAYDLTLVGKYTQSERRELNQIAEEAGIERRKKEAVEDRKKRQEVRLKQRRLGRNPMRDRLKKSREIMVLAEASLANKKPEDASRHARMALSFAPKDLKLQSRAEQIIQECDTGRAVLMAKRGEAVATTRPEEESARWIETMVKLAPNHVDVLCSAALMSRIVGEESDAMRYAQRATTAGPRNKKAWETMLDISERIGSWALAKRAMEHLLENEPRNKDYKEKLKRFKRELS
ncbi:MAG: J domain-containing protein [Deltaproteobacteria bacterium]|nr:J domain-containing protein [Deltaproteobacteria bacterium]